MFRDDEKDRISTSSSRFFERGGKQTPSPEQAAKKKKQEQQKGKLKLDILKGQMKQQKDPDAQKNPDDKMNTVSTMEEAQADVLHGDIKVSAEREIQKQQREQEAKNDSLDPMQQMG